MGLKTLGRKLLHFHDDQPRGARLNTTQTSASSGKANPTTTNSPSPEAAPQPSDDGQSANRSSSWQNQNEASTSQSNTLPNRRREGNEYRGPNSSFSQPARQSLTSYVAPSRHESGLVRTGARLVSDKVDCVVILVYDGHKHRAIDDRVWWLDRSQYVLFDKAAVRWLRDWGVPHTKQLYRKSGRCRLINREDGREFNSRILETEEQWSEVLPFLITSFVSKHPYVKFFLEILWEYSDLSINKVDNVRYAKTVQKAIHDKLKPNWQNKKYIPRKDLDEILSESTVKELIHSDGSLNDIANLDRDDFTQKVVLDASRLLAICVYTDLPLACLYELIRKGCLDTNLPLTERHCPKGTYEVNFENFVLWQGAFIAHEFEDDRGRPKHRKVPDAVVLPIMFDKEADLLGEGGFGWVYKVHIDPDHHLFSVDRDNFFALKIFKELGSQTETDFHNELSMLSTLSEASHPHITGHLASWTHRNRFYMLFERAETHLGTFLRLQPHPELVNSNVRWLLLQLKGLAEGVRHIHILGPAGLGPEALNLDDQPPRKQGRAGFHHDLKPQNILLFASKSLDGCEPALSDLTLKISDFGAARINVILSQSGFGKSNFSPQHSALVRGDPVYSAPDYTLERKTSRPYDIWSLGCVFLETLLWTFGLSDCDLNVFEFDRLESHHSRSTKFWHQDDRGKIILKEPVVRRLKQLQDYCHARGVFQHLIRLTARMLTITPKDRPKAPDVCNDLEAMLIQAERDFQVEDFYRYDIRAHVEIAAPPTNDGTSRRPSIDERSICGFETENGLLQAPSTEQRRPRSISIRRESDARQLEYQNGDLNQDSYRLSPIVTRDFFPIASHHRSPSIAISDHDAPFISVPVEEMQGSSSYTEHPLLGSHSTTIGREDLARPARPRARSTDSRRSHSSP